MDQLLLRGAAYTTAEPARNEAGLRSAGLVARWVRTAHRQISLPRRRRYRRARGGGACVTVCEGQSRAPHGARVGREVHHAEMLDGGACPNTAPCIPNQALPRRISMKDKGPISRLLIGGERPA